jgi:predicted 3-demethylubiquinone-9 3-methyltransferase (glyoxalase superfamily)
MAQKIVPMLWFDKETEEAVNFYVSLFGGGPGSNKDSRIVSIQRYEKGMNVPGGDSMEGKVLTAIFDLAGYRFMALDGGPIFKLNPSISFMLNFDPSKDNHARENLDRMWGPLSSKGTVLMPLQEYPFSKHYGWVQDQYGVSWQLILTNPEGEERPFIIPSLMFVGKVAGKAEEATDFYLSVFKNSKRGMIVRYPKGMEPDKEGTTQFTDFMLENQWFAAMDSAHEHKFAFNEAVSFVVNSEDQKEVDEHWRKLSAVPESEQCGWLKDKYGLSWQIIPERMGELLGHKDRKRALAATNAMLKMKKIVIADLEKAFNEVKVGSR